jgi:hypothetical protein
MSDLLWLLLLVVAVGVAFGAGWFFGVLRYDRKVQAELDLYYGDLAQHMASDSLPVVLHRILG